MQYSLLWPVDLHQLTETVDENSPMVKLLYYSLYATGIIILLIQSSTSELNSHGNGLYQLLPRTMSCTLDMGHQYITLLYNEGLLAQILNYHYDS